MTRYNCDLKLFENNKKAKIIVYVKKNNKL